MNTILKISLICGFLIISLSVAYYLILFLPKQEAMRLEYEKQKEEARILAEKKKEDERKQEQDKIRAIQEAEKSLMQARLNDCLEEAYQKSIKSRDIYDQLDCDKYDIGDLKARCMDDKIIQFKEILATREKEEALCYERFHSN